MHGAGQEMCCGGEGYALQCMFRAKIIIMIAGVPYAVGIMAWNVGTRG